MKLLIFESEGTLDNEQYLLLKKDIETSIRQGFLILGNGIKVREVEITRERNPISLEGSRIFNEETSV